MITPQCNVFGQCGGCQYQDHNYSDELKLKEAHLKSLLDYVDEKTFQPVVSSPREYHYRNRLDLKLRQTKEGKVFIGFTPKEGRGVIEIDECPIAREEISLSLPQIKREAQEKLTPKYRQANLVIRCGDDERVFWGGIGRRSNELPQKDYLWTMVENKKVFYSLDTFFQANLSILPKVFEVIKSFSFWDKQTIFYDLYGGVGLFGIGLIDAVKKVILIEDCKPAIKVAEYNKEYNQLTDFDIISGRVEDHLSRLAEEEEGQKIAMIDPPRAGLSKEACQFFAGTKDFSYFMYLSCNPEALARDLKVFLKEGWLIEQIIPFDFFPKTKHLETLVLIGK